MIYQFHIPRFPLDQFVEVLVYFSDVSLEHNFDRFLPNGDTEILIDFHDTPQFIYDNSSLGNLPLAAAYSLLPMAIMTIYLLVARRMGAFESL